MSWYSEQKHWKDTLTVDLYHLSPNKISVFQPLSKFNTQPGLFFSPSYKSAINDWYSYVSNHRHRNHSQNTLFEELWNRQQELESKAAESTIGINCVC